VLHFNARLYSHCDCCVNARRCHTPEVPQARELCTGDRKLQLLLGVRWIQHGERERFPILAESRANIQRIGVAARIDRGLVATGRIDGLRLRRVPGYFHRNGTEMFAIHLEQQTCWTQDRIGSVFADHCGCERECPYLIQVGMAEHLVKSPSVGGDHLVRIWRSADIRPFVETDRYRLCFELGNALQVLLVMLVLHADLRRGCALPFDKRLRPGADLLAFLKIRSLSRLMLSRQWASKLPLQSAGER